MEYYVNVYEDRETFHTELDSAGVTAETHTAENGDLKTYVRTELRVGGVIIDNDVFFSEVE